MNVLAVLLVTLAVSGPGGNKDGVYGPRHPILPYPPEVPKPPRVVVEEDEELQDLVDDLEDYRVQFYRNELGLRFGWSKRRVRRVLGRPDVATRPPDGAGRVLWWYGDSFVVFRDKQVVAWEQNSVKLPFGLDVAPRDYLPRSAYRDVGPATVTGILTPPPAGGPGLPGTTTPPSPSNLSELERAGVDWAQALAAVRMNPRDAAALSRALEAGRRYYGLRNGDGRFTDLDRAEVQRAIDQAVSGGGGMP
jgi:hypothetical protein